MKFMKLGSKPDIFQTHGNVTVVGTDLASDIAVEVNGGKLHLHKFPLLSKSGHLNELVAEARDSKKEEIQLTDFPGGLETFILCAKFCYGIAITLNAFDVVAVRCAAEYLEMTETIEKGNLVFKMEVFLSVSILRSWKDSIIALGSSKLTLPWSEDLKIVSRCIDSITSKASVDPSKVDWSFTYKRAHTSHDSKIAGIEAGLDWNGVRGKQQAAVPKDWWIEDICRLEIDLFWRIMVAVKAKGRMGHELIGEAVRVYSSRWLPSICKGKTLSEIVKGDDYNEIVANQRLLLETIVSLIPSERGSLPCSFLLRFLKAANILGASSSSKLELAKRIGLQLEDACLTDLLIPTCASDALFDIEIVRQILDHFLSQDQSPPLSPKRIQLSSDRRRTRSAENIDLLETRTINSTTHLAHVRVTKLIDGYLAEIARDSSLPLSKFIALANAIPDSARPIHDTLYKAIDIYLKEHPDLSKSERKNICKLMDCKKLSMDACIHAAQNDRLPLRVVVQVLFFEQVRTTANDGFQLNELPTKMKPACARSTSMQEATDSSTTEDGWEAVHHDCKTLKGDLAHIEQIIAEAEKERMQVQQKVTTQTKAKSYSKLIRLFKTPWKNIPFFQSLKGSETSKGSESPVSQSTYSVEATASRQQRHSLS